MKNKKIIILALALLIIAGIIVVGLKGFNVDFMLKAHDSIEYTINDDFEVSDVENIAKDVFGEKKFKIRIIELFNDAVSINAEKITTEEADKLIKKLDDKYKKTENATETEENNTEVANTNYEIISNPKIRLFSLLKVYIKPSIIAGIVILAYMLIRYKKLNSIKVIASLVFLVAITVLSILSVLAIVRFPINVWVLPCVLTVVLFELIVFCMNKEKKLEELKEE